MDIEDKEPVIMNFIEEEEQTGEPQKAEHLSGMYEGWFLDYASYVILERAVPHIHDGLKPVQRRILHSMKRMDDGRYNKVANIIGHTMQFHPHGDTSIGGALVQMGQKNLLIDTQGNWGNIHTGDDAAAARYIEARLTKFALDVVFNPKTTDWKASYDGRNKEPIVLPMKFPLLLAHGTEGIAVGLASKILPHNFNELIDACISHLRGQAFELFPDFPTGGSVDISKYKDGARGGSVKVRAKIVKKEKSELVITELPFGKNTTTLIESIIKANDKGKIKIRKIEDNTAENVEISIILHKNTSPDKTIDALYAFTDCEVSISPNCCVVENDTPHFINVSKALQESADNTLALLRQELLIKKAELEEAWHLSSLEKIFIENRIYNRIEECETFEAIIETIDDGLEPFKHMLLREVTRDDIIKLTEIKIKRISRYDSFKADELLKSLEEQIEETKHNLGRMVDFTIDYYKRIKKKYGKEHPRKTEIRSFDVIDTTRVVSNNVKLYVNKADGFIGTSLRKDEFVCDCSDIDEIIAIKRDGSYVITQASDKEFVGKDILHVDVYKRNDERTIYNIVYFDGVTGFHMTKRCAITGISRNKEYSLVREHPQSKIVYMTVNPNGEAETINITLKPRPRLKKRIFDYNFAELDIKGKAARGNILTRFAVFKLKMSSRGKSTIGGKKIWFDTEVRRLNEDNYGDYIGEFRPEDRVLVIDKHGQFKQIECSVHAHFEDIDIKQIEKHNSEKIYTVVYYDADLGYNYVKRCTIENTALGKMQTLIGENEESSVIKFIDDKYPVIRLVFGGDDTHRDPKVVDVDEFIGVKSFKARGKRLSTYEIKKIEVLEPLQKDPVVEEVSEIQNEDTEDSSEDSQQLSLEM